MNQDIIVGDEVYWQPEEQRLAFSSHWQGRQVFCFITQHRLEHLAGQQLPDEASAMLAFEQVRFDIEELVCERIEEEAFAPDGSISL